MLAIIESHPNAFRLTCFLFFFCFFALYEWKFPRRQLTVSKAKRWLGNLSLTMFNSLMIRLVFPLGALGLALLCQQWGIGVFNLFALPFGLSVIVSIIILDGIIWYQHYLFHKIPMLWRLHQVHHADLDLDLSSAARFHTLEMLLSMLVKFAAIALLGAPAIAVLLFEVILSSLALFNHSNIRLSPKLDKKLRMLLVTPDMHRIHHSIYYQESNTNFGFCLSVWDKWFFTYYEKPKDGQLQMQLGIKQFSTQSETIPLSSLLIMPFKTKRK